MKKKIKEIKPNEIVPGYFGKFFHGEKMTLAFWEVKKNSKIPEHNHIHEQCLFVKKGKFELTIEGKKKILHDNELIFIPSRKHHSGVALTDCELIDIFSPNRKEYSNN